MGTNIQNRIGERVKTLRETQALKQKEVADKLHISVSAYSKLESGERGISSENCIALADIFGVSCDYILRGIDAENADICRITALNQTAIEWLMVHKINEVNALESYYKHYEASIAIHNKWSELVRSKNATIEDDLEREIEKCKNDEAVYNAYKQEAEEAEKQKKCYRLQHIYNRVLNEFISDHFASYELMRAAYLFVTSVEDAATTPDKEDFFGCDNININYMDAARYAANRAFANFFDKIFKNANFYRAVSEMPEAEINLCIEKGLLQDD